MDYNFFIDGRCFTNLDGYEQELWPHKFCMTPKVGDCVESRSSGKVLKIVRITHRQNANTYEPELLIELHK